MEDRGPQGFTKMLFVLICTLSTINIVAGYSTGAPASTCADLVPRHSGGSIQDSYPPYQVLAAAGQGRIRLTLGSPQGLAYEGFLILARDAETGDIVGEFTNVPTGARHLECTPGIKNAVTHSDPSKKQNLEIEWEAPDNYEGTIIFNSTFAQDYATYWVGVESPRISALKGTIDVMSTSPDTFSSPRMTTPPYYEQRSNADSETSNSKAAFYDSCGTTKNCFGSSNGCIESKDCMAAVTLFVQGEQYIFEMMTRQGKYIAVGLSKDEKMGGDNVVECTNDGGAIGLYMSENKGKHNERIPTPPGAIELLESSITDDALTCKFMRTKETTVNGKTYDLARESYYLLLAAGNQLKAGGLGVGYHDVVRAASSEAKILADIGKFATSSQLLIRLHGALMLAAWIGTASVGMLLARYYKQTWVNSQVCGKDQWFAWHRFFMVLTWSMTLASFVIIFVELGEWSSETIHASLGLATTILCFIQPFMAAMRPHPGTPKRTLFNWVHWFVGNAAHICAIIAMFFAVRLTKANLPEWVDWILVAYVVFYILTHLILTFAGCASDRQDNLRINAFPMKDIHTRSSMGHPDARRDAPHSGFRQSILGVYLFAIAAFTVILIVVTALAPIETTWNSFKDTISNY